MSNKSKIRETKWVKIDPDEPVYMTRHRAGDTIRHEAQRRSDRIKEQEEIIRNLKSALTNLADEYKFQRGDKAENSRAYTEAVAIITA